MNEYYLSLTTANTDSYQKILPIGVFHTKKYGRFEITSKLCEQMEKHFKDKVMGEKLPYIDIDHDGKEAHGWIKDVEHRSDGLYAEINWNKLGREKVGNGVYKYFSASFGDHTDINTGKNISPVLKAVALTNNPVMNNLPEAHLSEQENNSAHGDGDKNSKGANMNPEDILKEIQNLSEEDKTTLFAAVNLSDNNKVEALKEVNTELSERVNTAEALVKAFKQKEIKKDVM